ncbi:MAG: hypothetical protein P1V51_19665 [Deltaproteobacteria bacterium]|nr:hypothetical protein [Deltaproteobacteria bacterium]
MDTRVGGARLVVVTVAGLFALALPPAVRAVPPSAGPASTLDPPTPPKKPPVIKKPEPTAPAPAPAAPPKEPAPATEIVHYWAGHQVVWGKKKVSIVGDVSTRSDTFLVARAVERPDSLTIEQQPCRSIFQKTAGVKTSMRSKKPDFMPMATVEFVGLRGGWLQALPWIADWQKKDYDADGHPGVTIDVESFFCSGEMYITKRSESVARGRFDGDRFEGVLRTSVVQTLLGASASCLEWGVSDRVERLQGRFLFVPVPAGTTCKSLLERPWPALAAPLAE